MRYLALIACLLPSLVFIEDLRADEAPDAADIVHALQVQRADAMDAAVMAQARLEKLRREIRQIDAEQDADQDAEEP